MLFAALLACSVQEPAPPPPPVVDLALCLDTSGSMDGLLEAAKTKLWAVVNDLALARPTPRLRVALLTYGNDGHDAAAGWVRVDTGFTEDLDAVSQALFALSTNGGTELVGRVVGTAVERLDWSPGAAGLRLIVVAGNESADQDQETSFRDRCRGAIERGILVNAIYCGGAADPDAAGWQEVARLADGAYANIDANQNLAIATPFDERMAALSTALNATYVPYGASGAAAWANQSLQDANAVASNSTAAAERAACKVGGLYRCSWDLVDACRNGQIKLEEVKSEELPEALRGHTREQLQAHLQAQWEQRSGLQMQIQELGVQRDAFLEQELAKLAAAGEASFDAALRAAVRAQAQARGFQFAAATMPQP